ncbi:MAG: TolC family protein [Bacteriovorax sp.]|jgi:outer membrane protein TolC
MPTGMLFKFTFIFLTTVSFAHAEAFIAEDSLEINSLNTKIETLNFNRKINRSAYLPELNLKTGLGSEKLLDNDYDTEKGPLLFLEGKLNLYRGGRDSNLQDKTDKEIAASKIEKEIINRFVKIEAFKLLTEIELLTKENALIGQELESNKNQELMARKKVNAGLTTSVDLLDFSLKHESLLNDLERNSFKRITLEKELIVLFGGSLSPNEISKSIKAAPQEAPDKNVSIETLPRIALLRQKNEINTIERKSVKAEYLPVVELNADWGYITPQNKLWDSDKEHRVALTVSIPLFSGFSTDYKYQQAVLTETQTMRELKQTQIDLEAKKDLQLKQIELSNKILLSLEKSRTSSQKYRELTISEYKRGVKNSPDVISASDKLLEIERKILETQNELLIAKFSFKETFKPYEDQ